MIRGTTIKVLAVAALLVMVGSSFYAPSLGLSALQPANAAVNACLAPQATAWVVDSGNNRVLEFLAPFYSGMSASVVIGQPNFVTAGSGEGHHQGSITAATLSSPTAMAMDSLGDIWITDSGNNRILEFAPPFTSGMSASVVLGQSSFTAGSNNGEQEHSFNSYSNKPTASSLFFPTAIAIDPKGNVWVADQGNNRIVEFTPTSTVNGVPLFTTGQVASLVIGATDFKGDGDGNWRDMQYQPGSFTFDSAGNLWVADTGNNRILEYQLTASGTATSGGSTTLVDSSQSWIANQWVGFTVSITSGTGINSVGTVTANTATTLTVNSWSSAAPALGSGYLFSNPPNGLQAVVAIGQPTLTNSPYSHHGYGWGWGDNGGVANQSRLNSPSGITFDNDGNLWVADSGNNRILEFSPPFSTDMLATQVLGQSSSFTSGAENHGWSEGDAGGFFSPGQLAFDASGNLWVTDAQNNRVIVFQPPLWGGSVATMVLGQPANYQSTTSGVAQNVMNDPNGIMLTAPGATSFKLAWVRQIDPVSRSTIFVTAPPADSVLNHAFVALSGTPAIYVVRVSDGTVLYRSQSYNSPQSQYGLIPNQQFTLSGLGVPVAAYSNSFNIAWVTTGGRSPTSYWLFIASVPVNQLSVPSNSMQSSSNTQAISLNNLRDPASHTLFSLNPVSLAFTSDGTYLLVGGTNGYVAAFVRSCNTGANGVNIAPPPPPVAACITLTGKTSGDTALICNNPSSSSSGTQSFTITVTNGNRSQSDLGVVSLLVSSKLAVPSSQAQGCTQGFEGRQSCGTWQVSVLGQNITWTPVAGGRNNNFAATDLDNGVAGTFTWTVTIPAGQASYVQGITVKWINNDVFPVTDTASGTFTTASTG